MAVVKGYLDWAIRVPGPVEKGRYPSDPERAMSEILYIVMHSAEGWEAFLRQGHRPGEDASWTFSNCQDGDFYQHYPLSALTFTSGGYIQNRDGLACENEGVKGQPLNAKQIANARRMREDVRAVCPNLRAPMLGAGFREHSELTNGVTSCPSGRIAPLYQSYLQVSPPEEENMTQDEFNALFKHAVDNVGLDSLDGGSLGGFHQASDNFIIDTVNARVAVESERVLAALASTPTLHLSEADIEAIANKLSESLAIAVTDEISSRLAN